MMCFCVTGKGWPMVGCVVEVLLGPSGFSSGGAFGSLKCPRGWCMVRKKGMGSCHN